MGFEYDPEKSQSNTRKHGIDFEQAGELWQDSGLLIIPSRYPGEPRFLAIGKIRGRHWTAVFTERSNSVRLISVRGSRDEEKALYDRNQQRQSGTTI